MNVRSIRSFHRQTQRPCQASGPFAPTAPPSPVKETVASGVLMR